MTHEQSVGGVGVCHNNEYSIHLSVCLEYFTINLCNVIFNFQNTAEGEQGDATIYTCITLDDAT